MADRVVGEREERLREALSRFVKATEKWSETNGIGWEDDANDRDQALGWSEEWFAEVEVSNRDVLAARSALASSPSPPDELREYVRRLLDELPGLVTKGVERGRKTNAPTERIVEGVLAHAANVESVRAALFGPVRGDEE